MAAAGEVHIKTSSAEIEAIIGAIGFSFQWVWKAGSTE
jgi:hypothetical protein